MMVSLIFIIIIEKLKIRSFIIMSIASKPIKSASLILTRNLKSETSLFNYQLLMLQKNPQSTWGKNLVFPGGIYDPLHDRILQQMLNLPSQLHATLIRQTFQQTGLCFTNQPIVQQSKLQKLSQIKIQYLKKCLTNNYKLDSRLYMEKLGQVIKPFHNFTPFIRLITIPQLPKRYDTTFFVHHLEQMKFVNFLKYAQHQKYLHDSQQIIKCDNQFQFFRWMTPAQILHEHFQNKVNLAPPQYMMINTMLNFYRFQQLKQYLNSSFVNNESDNSKYSSTSFGPNVVSLIKNKDQNSSKHIATMVGDIEYPYEHMLKTQSCPELKQQLRQWMTRQNRAQNQGYCRFQFSKPKEFFKYEYEVKINLQSSTLRKMKNFSDTQSFLKDQILI